MNLRETIDKKLLLFFENKIIRTALIITIIQIIIFLLVYILTLLIMYFTGIFETIINNINDQVFSIIIYPIWIIISYPIINMIFKKTFYKKYIFDVKHKKDTIIFIIITLGLFHLLGYIPPFRIKDLFNASENQLAHGIAFFVLILIYLFVYRKIVNKIKRNKPNE